MYSMFFNAGSDSEGVHSTVEFVVVNKLPVPSHFWNNN